MSTPRPATPPHPPRSATLPCARSPRPPPGSPASQARSRGARHTAGAQPSVREHGTRVAGAPTVTSPRKARAPRACPRRSSPASGAASCRVARPAHRPGRRRPRGG
ncbi:hypothetical protein DBR06_SOUSAS11110085, partial [Sousa chinensis]